MQGLIPKLTVTYWLIKSAEWLSAFTFGYYTFHWKLGDGT